MQIYIHLLSDGGRRQEIGGRCEFGHLIRHQIRIVDVFHQESEGVLEGERLRQKVPVVLQFIQRHICELWVERFHLGLVDKYPAVAEPNHRWLLIRC